MNNLIQDKLQKNTYFYRQLSAINHRLPTTDYPLRQLFIFISIVAMVWSFSACNHSVDLPPIIRLENELFAAKSPAQITALFKKYPYLKSSLTDNAAGISDSLLANQLYANVSNSSLGEFNQELKKQFGDMADLQAQFQTAFDAIQRDFPDFKPPRIATTVTGFLGYDLFVSDSVIVIGLDFFGGPKAKYRPNGLYNYQLRRYEKPFIVPSILFLLSKKYNKANPKDQSLLADMVWYGKGFEFVKHSLPDTPDSLIIGYSQKQLDDVYASQSDVWAYFLDRKLIFQTRDAEKQRFLGERPATVEISQYCPGGIARWVGWRIVSKYLAQNPNTTLPELMNDTKAQQIFEQSKYKGEADED
jgi:hypothetical protein